MRLVTRLSVVENQRPISGLDDRMIFWDRMRKREGAVKRSLVPMDVDICCYVCFIVSLDFFSGQKRAQRR